MYIYIHSRLLVFHVVTIAIHSHFSAKHSLSLSVKRPTNERITHWPTVAHPHSQSLSQILQWFRVTLVAQLK